MAFSTSVVDNFCSRFFIISEASNLGVVVLGSGVFIVGLGLFLVFAISLFLGGFCVFRNSV